MLGIGLLRVKLIFLGQTRASIGQESLSSDLTRFSTSLPKPPKDWQGHLARPSMPSLGPARTLPNLVGHLMSGICPAVLALQ